MVVVAVTALLTAATVVYIAVYLRNRPPTVATISERAGRSRSLAPQPAAATRRFPSVLGPWNDGGRP